MPYHKGDNHHFWKGGRQKMKNGYYMLIMRDHYKADKKGRVYEHVYFYEQYNKCCLLSWGVVHHKDENIQNNMPWNLQGMMRRDHFSMHMKVDMSKRFCLFCKSKNTFIDKRGYHLWKRYKDNFLCNICETRYRRGKICVLPSTIV